MRIQLFCDNVGQVPAEQPFEMAPEWQEFSMGLTSFTGCNLEGLQAIVFSAGPTPGTFSLQIDEASFR